MIAIDRETYDGAAALIAEHGHAALMEAAARAGRSARGDNPLRYARWCGVGRAVLMILDPGTNGTRH